MQVGARERVMRALAGLPRVRGEGVVDVFQILLNIKAVIALITVLWILFDQLCDARGRQNARKLLAVVLVLIAAAGVCAYFDFGSYPKFGRFMNPHDLYHYYLGSKYSREVGYSRLYQCVTVATWENTGQVKHKAVRRMEDYSYVAGQDVVRQADKYKKLFAEERWPEFKKDVAFFDALLGRRFSVVNQDMGYNATPVWNMIARPITNRLPTQHMELLVLFDLALVALMVLAVWTAFGFRTALLALLFFCTCFPMSYTHSRGGFLRLDWVTMVVMAVCMVKLNRYKTAGALVAYAAMARVFPLVFAFGLGGKLLWDMLGTRKLSRKYVDFFATLSVVCVALIGLSVWADAGFEPWSAFFKKIAVHNSHIAPVRVGFKYLFLMAYENPFRGWTGFKSAMIQTFEERQLIWWLVQGSVLLLSLYLVRKLDDYEAIAYCYVPSFFLAAPTFYYHVVTIVALFFFLPKRDQLLRTVGVVGMFLIWIGLFGLNNFLPLNLMLSFIMGCMLLALCLYIIGVAFWVSLSRADAASPPAAEERRAGAAEST